MYNTTNKESGNNYNKSQSSNYVGGGIGENLILASEFSNTLKNITAIITDNDKVSTNCISLDHDCQKKNLKMFNKIFYFPHVGRQN